MKQPKVTVLITVKNNANTIKKCIESVLNLNYKNYDILVVDAFSDDGTYKILKSFGKRIRLYQLRGWAPKAYNWAMQKINSEFTAFTDGDCVVDKNWLQELVKGFKSKEILAVAGFCGTIKFDNDLQKAIGRELEERFKHFKNYVLRAPTMNLCVRTEALKKIKFNEKYKVAFETDFGYRLNEIGKIYYNKNAIIYHYHRASWKDFFKQQKTYGEYTFLLSTEHKKRIMGDHITNPYMIAQVPAFWLTLLFLLLSFFDLRMLFVSLFFIIAMITVFLIKIHKLNVRLVEYPLYFTFFLVRAIAWSLGLISGVFHFLNPKKDKKRITFVLEYYEPHIGGVEILFKNLAEGLVKLGYDVNVLTLKLPNTKSEEIINGVKVYRVKVPITYQRYLFSLFALPKAFHLIRKSDIVHTTTYSASFPAWLASKIFNKPCVITVHEFFGDRWQTLLGVSPPFAKILKTLEKSIISLPFDKFITVSKSTKKYLQEKNVKNIEVIYNGVDYNLFDYKKVNGRKIRSKLGLKNNFVFFFWGRPGISKGLEYFVNAMPKIAENIPNSKFLLIVANDPYYRYKLVLDLIRANNIREKILLLNPVPRTELPNYIDAADCVVLPSLSEGFGLNVAEACALNKTVVTSNVDSIPEVISGKYILVKPKDPDAIANACIDIYKGKYKKSKKKLFMWEDTIKNHSKLYEKLI